MSRCNPNPLRPKEVPLGAPTNGIGWRSPFPGPGKGDRGLGQIDVIDGIEGIVGLVIDGL